MSKTEIAGREITDKVNFSAHRKAQGNGGDHGIFNAAQPKRQAAQSNGAKGHGGDIRRKNAVNDEADKQPRHHDRKPQRRAQLTGLFGGQSGILQKRNKGRNQA